MMWSVPVSLLAQTDGGGGGGGGAAAGPTADDLRTGTIGEGVVRLKGLGTDVLEALPAAGVAVVVFLVFIFIGWLIKKGVHRYAGATGHRNLALAAGRIAYGLTIVIGILVAAVIVFPNFTPTKLLASLGVGGVVLGLAFKDVLQNYLAGVLLLVAEPFRIDDQIVFKDYEGTVVDIQTRATFLRTYDGRRVVIPNAELFTNSVTVNTAFERRRLEYDIGIGYGDDIDGAKRLILEAIRETGVAAADPEPEVLTYDLAASTVNLRARWWITPPKRHDALDARDAVLAAVKNKLTAAGIDLPFPTQQLLLHDQTESTDGDRRHQREGWPAGEGEAPESARIGQAVRETIPTG